MTRMCSCANWRTVLSAVAALGISLASAAHADVILFNPNGGVGGPGNLQVATFDEKVDNALSVGAVTAIGATPIGVTSAPFATNYQATMVALVGAGGQTLAAPGTTIGGVTTNQITVIAHFFETATVNSANSITLNTNTSQAGSFIEIYSNPTPTANDLAGTGFRDGNLILKGVAAPGVAGAGSFSNTPGVTQPFDQFNTNNYPGITSVVGSGATKLTFTVTDFATNYFLTPLTSFAIQFNTSNVVPFGQADPSAAFYGSPDTGGTLDGSGRPVVGPGTAPNVPAAVGSVNGQSGPNVQFQSDGNSSFVAAIPEPSSILTALTGFSFVCLAGLRSQLRRNRMTAA
jgi:hypothetical protein